jgi:hypothetical protein
MTHIVDPVGLTLHSAVSPEMGEIVPVVTVELFGVRYSELRRLLTGNDLTPSLERDCSLGKSLLSVVAYFRMTMTTPEKLIPQRSE